MQKGMSEKLNFAMGTLSIGFSSPVPVIRDLKKWVINNDPNIIYLLDASPGTSCPVVEIMRGSDFVLFVTEPTPFGLHDLKLVAELNEKEFQLPCGIVVNKSGRDDEMIETFANDNGIPVLERIPLSRRIAKAYSSGSLLIDKEPKYQEEFVQLLNKVNALAVKSVAIK